jgi:hypothetical protein
MNLAVSKTLRFLKEKMEILHHGEYSTRRPVLNAWDRMEAEGESIKWTRNTRVTCY